MPRSLCFNLLWLIGAVILISTEAKHHIMTHSNIAIIGAGVSGLAAARELPASSYQLFEKSRGPGGRLASKRLEQQRADIGAQFFTVRDARFDETVKLASEAGAVARWEPQMGTFRNQQPVSSPDTQTRYVGAPYMNAFGRFLAEPLVIRDQHRIQSVSREKSGYSLTTTENQHFTAEQVLVTTPVDQMGDLLSEFPITPITSRFTMDPTWTVVLSIDESLLTEDGIRLDACFGGDHPAIDFISVERSKVGRNNDFVVIHSTPQWATEHLERDSAWVLAQFQNIIFDVFAVQSSAIIAHRWRYARPTDPKTTTQKGVYQIDQGLWIAGDYLAGGRVEGAYLAGLEAATRLQAN